MANQTEMTLKLTRKQICDVSRALCALTIDFRREAAAATDKESKERAEKNATFWAKLHDNIRGQLKAQDEAHGIE